MMENNWANFLKNLGEWEGSFTSISLDGELLNSTPSILNLEGLENNQLVRFRLRRFGPGGYSEEPISDYTQEYRSIGRQNIFLRQVLFLKVPFSLHPFLSSARNMVLLPKIVVYVLFSFTISKEI